jgi:hypothetical protein
MGIQEFIDETLCEITDSFTAEECSRLKLQAILCKYPNTTPHETWIALPMLFWRRILNSGELRSMPYLEFLSTPYWLAVSEYVKSLRPWCALCVDPLSGPLEVHHRTYAHRGGEWQYLDDLTVLCHECHDWISKKPSRWKFIQGRG